MLRTNLAYGYLCTPSGAKKAFVLLLLGLSVLHFFIPIKTGCKNDTAYALQRVRGGGQRGDIGNGCR